MFSLVVAMSTAMFSLVVAMSTAMFIAVLDVMQCRWWERPVVYGNSFIVRIIPSGQKDAGIAAVAVREAAGKSIMMVGCKDIGIVT